MFKYNSFQLNTVRRYFFSHDFRRALLMTLTVFLCGLALFLLDYQKPMVGVIIGILLTSLCDIQGSNKKRNTAMLLSVALNAFNFILINFLFDYQFLLIIYIGITVFFVSYLSVFGNRATVFALSGLMGIVLSMVRQYSGNQIWEHAFFLICGGFIYILISIIFHQLTKKSQVNEVLGELMFKTTNFLQLQFNSLKKIPKKEEHHILQLHQEIIEQQEMLRNLLFTKEWIGGSSSTRNRQMMLLVELVDLAELATAQPIDIELLRKNDLWNEEVFRPFLEIYKLQVTRLKQLAKAVLDHKKITHFDIEEKLKETRKSISIFAEKHTLNQVRPISLSLLNFHDYLEKQQDKLDSMAHLIKNEHENQQQFILDYFGKFLTSEEYSWRGFKESFSLSSPILRHSIRMTIAVVGGYLIGLLLNVKNPYWIMLTVVVIMRPSYGLTKTRSFQRVYGTILGVIIAVVVVLLTNNIYVYLSIALLSMIFAFSLLNRNYLLAALAITLNVVFAFFLILPDQWGVIQYRFIDTLIGAAVCVLSGYLILPYWEYKTLINNALYALENNRNYLKQIIDFYKNPENELNYRLSRKQAFSATGELNAAFQKFTQDPKSKQRNFNNYYDWIILNRNILASLANLGTYIKNHHRADIKKSFEKVLLNIESGLEKIQFSLLNRKNILLDNNDSTSWDDLNFYWENLEKIRNQEIAIGKIQIDDNLRLELQEVKLIIDELKWLEELTQKLTKINNEIIK